MNAKVKRMGVPLILLLMATALLYWIVQDSWSPEALSWIWIGAGILAVLYLLTALLSERNRAAGKSTHARTVGQVLIRYRYLMRQLVLRDFKVKYKASVLGVLWSFLNPLLMTLVYYVVFSSLFSSQENFVVYLMTGTVLFNYVSETSSLGINSIVGNAGLITKVYMPKYIYPISKVLSSAINLIISMVPLLVLLALSGVPFRKSLLLIPLLILFLIIFCAGLAMALSTFMVFFRDTQFLWGVIIMMWNFLSPVFYPESIIPDTIIHWYRMNPLYQYMTFFRTITISGTAPDPTAFGRCLLASVVSFLIGLWIFRSQQKKFAVNL